MSAIQLQIPEDMQRELHPYRNHLRQLLELGLEEWKRQEKTTPDPERERLLNVLRAADGITLPSPAQGKKARPRWTPVSIQGRPVSEIVMELRD